MKIIFQWFKRKSIFGPTLYLLLFIFLTLPAFLLIPSITSDNSIALFGKSEISVTLTLFIVYCLFCLFVSIKKILNLNFSTALIFFLLAFLIALVFFLSIFFLNPEIRSFLSHTIFLIIFLLLIFYIGNSKNAASTKIPNLILFFIGLLSLYALASKEAADLKNRVFGGAITEEETIPTAFYDIKKTKFTNKIPDSYSEGGGIDKLYDKYILSTGSGDIYVFSINDISNNLDIEKLPYRVPINFEEFKSSVANNIRTEKFRVMDLIVREVGENIELYSTHHYWFVNKNCYVLRLSKLTLASDFMQNTDPNISWKTIYESNPCLPIRKKGDPFVGQQSGGRMAFLNHNTMLLSVGDHEFDGVNSEVVHPQVKTSSYGKIISLDLSTFDNYIYSYGHRNSQGIFIDKEKNVWISEHGPQGGDEINLIKEGLNYGWPYVTYGTNYGKQNWPLNKFQGRHLGYEMPLYSWYPAIAPSSLIKLENTTFSYWENDLILSTLKAKSLYRIRINDETVRLIEPIYIDEKVRAMVEGHNGEIVLWTHNSDIVTIKKVDKNLNLRASFSSCIGCHAIDDSDSHGIGPNLNNIIGRKIASAENYRYSDSLKSINGVWTKDLLNDFIKDPQSIAQGTSMIYEGIKDEDERSEIIEYLERNGN